MGTITKQDAAILFAYSFKLVDKEGKEWTIQGVYETLLHVLKGGNDRFISYNQIGTDYWILKRPESHLTKSIVVEGKEIVPIVELMDLEGSFTENRPYELNAHKETFSIQQGSFRFIIKDFNFGMWIGENPTLVDNQEQLFHRKYSLHFIDLPEGTYREIL